MSRYPFPVPYGWFQIAWADDLAVGEARAAYHFGQHLVVWRGEDGTPHVQDAFCPHLGAHIGHGGTVHGCEIRCPFHGWMFDADGCNTDIPYAERVNRKGRLRTYPTVERNGLVMTWYHPDQADPMWEVPEFEQFGASASSVITRTFRIAAAWQELAENGVDSAHFRYVHHTAEVPVLELYEPNGPLAKMRSAQKFVTPQGVVEGRIDVDTFGPGLTFTHFSGFVDLYLLGCNTPVDAENCDLQFTFVVGDLGDEATNSSVGKAFAAEISQQVEEDRMIWEHKSHIVRPALATTDGPFTKFRKWASQFYVENPADAAPPSETGVYPPPVWFDRMDDAPAKATVSARLDNEY